MAWAENETWKMEQGLDALVQFQLFEDTEQTNPLTFVGVDVNATMSDASG